MNNLLTGTVSAGSFRRCVAPWGLFTMTRIAGEIWHFGVTDARLNGGRGAEVRRQAGEAIDQEMQALAGLTAVEYVFFYPETNDIVIAGPAEGFFADPTDRLIGMETGRPVVLLEDLVTALRAYAPGGNATSVISVSIRKIQV